MGFFVKTHTQNPQNLKLFFWKVADFLKSKFRSLFGILHGAGVNEAVVYGVPSTCLNCDLPKLTTKKRC